LGEEQKTGEAMVERSRNRGINCRVKRARNWGNTYGDEQSISSAIVEGEQGRAAIDSGRAINRVEVVGGGARHWNRQQMFWEEQATGAAVGI